MSIISITFFAFLIAIVISYYSVNIKYRYIVLLIGNYIFYGWKSPYFILFLVFTTIVTYVGGLQVRNNKKKYYFYLLLNLSILIICKYSNFIISNINNFFSLRFESTMIQKLNIILPLGLSFYVFQSSTYLHDVYFEKIDPEYNFLRYAAFVSFFPTLLSGPIQKSRNLLPQMKEPFPFDFDRARKGFVLIIYGIFQKIVVAYFLKIIIDYPTNKMIIDNNSSAFYILSAISFSLYIYADFSSYSDIARGVSKLFGINIQKNFKNPYLSTSLTEFWTRWHCSLNEWFTEIIYIPLGGSRKGKVRKFINIFIVFFISGLWHGASWNFVLWGVINGLLVIIEQIVNPLKSYVYRKLCVDEKNESIILFQRAFVFCMITITWVFFNVSDVKMAIQYIKQITIYEPVRLFVSDIFTFNNTVPSTIILYVSTLVFCIIQYMRKNEKEVYVVFARQPIFIQITLLSFLIMFCIFVFTSNKSVINMDFLYFNF